MSVHLALQRIAAQVLKREAHFCRLSRPMLSFTFDDFPRSALVNGSHILAEYSCWGTYYASMSLMGTKSELGEMFTAEDLVHLVEAGHEVGCHTYDHIPCRGLSQGRTLETCERNRKAIAEVLPGYKVSNFAFPFGSVGLRSKSALSSSYVSCRGIYPGINNTKIDFGLLSSYPLTSAEHVKALIERTIAKCGWLILYTHDVCESPSRYGCTPGSLRSAVQFAVHSAIDVLPIADAIAQLI